jgi:hypothetical protein
MIQPTTENKYRFDMLVSAGPMGLACALFCTRGAGAARSIFEIFDQWIALAGANRRLKQVAGAKWWRLGRLLRDPTGKLASTGGSADDLRQ